MTRHGKPILEHMSAWRCGPANMIRCGRFLIKVDRAKDLLMLALCVAGLVIVTAAVTYTEVGSNPTWRLLLLILGLLGAAVGGICLLVSILRSDKNN